MDRSTGTPLGFALLLLFAVAFGWVVWGGHPHFATAQADPALANFSTADLRAAAAEPALDWPKDMAEPMTNYVGRRVNAFGLTVTGVDADEGFWVQKDNRRAWVQLAEPVVGQRPPESPYTVRVGDVVSLSGTVYPHDPNYPSKIYFCPGHFTSANELSRAPTHLAVKVDALKFGTG
jgi:hypothetical protein